MNIIFIASEAHPFVKTGGLGDVCGALPLALENVGLNVSIFLPKYSSIRLPSPTEWIDDRCSRTSIGKNVSVYLIEHPEYFERRPGVYGENDRDYPDNIERFQYFSSEALRVINRLSLPVDIIHCHDWQTALVPVYWKELFREHPKFSKVKTVMTIHNLAFQGVFPAGKYATLGLDRHLFGLEGFEFYGQVNLLKASLIWSDKITTVSPRYSQEIQTKEFGCGLQDILKTRGASLQGILNGLDYNLWDPQKDTLISQKFSGVNLKEYKAENKTDLQETLHFPDAPDVPLLGFIARLSHQKGLDLILESMDELMSKNIQVVIQGTGSPDYHRRLMEKAEQYPKQLAVCLRFDEHLAHQVYAGSDFFLMPSTFEPCGLGQMIALRYGSLPIVYRTGGLADTVVGLKDSRDQANGFVFDNYQKSEFLKTVDEALAVYRDRSLMGTLIKRAMAQDLSWTNSAQEYKRMYECLLSD